MYNVTLQNQVMLNHQQAGDIVGEVLMQDFDFISQEVNETAFKRDLTKVQIEDWNNSMEVRDAMKVLLKYYLTHDKYTQFMELQRAYGNV